MTLLAFLILLCSWCLTAWLIAREALRSAPSPDRTDDTQ